MAVDGVQFRQALGLWASGVTIVTAGAGGRVHGMTVSAFSSVSLDPPLVLVCAERSSNTRQLIEAAGAFAVHVLEAGQRALAQRFASTRDEWRRFEGIEPERGATGAPRIPGALAALDCRLVATHPAGDHVIYVGEVQQIATREGEPLVFCQSSYRVLGPARGGSQPDGGSA